MSWKLLRSKTVWGAVAVAVGSVLAAPAVTVPVILQALGVVLSAAGVRSAINQGPAEADTSAGK